MCFRKQCKDTSSQIYSVLINDNWIIEKNVIIYEYSTFYERKNLQYQKDNLEFMFYKLLNVYDEIFNIYKSYIVEDKE